MKWTDAWVDRPAPTLEEARRAATRWAVAAVAFAAVTVLGFVGMIVLLWRGEDAGFLVPSLPGVFVAGVYTAWAAHDARRTYQLMQAR